MMASEYFDLRELVHPDIFDKAGIRSYDFLHPMLPDTLDSIREKFGPITVNNWHMGGNFKSSGLRKPDDIGAKFSSHKFGCAADCKFKNITPIEVQNYIINNPDKFPHITRMENAKITKTWLHIEVGHRKEKIKVFNP